MSSLHTAAREGNVEQGIELIKKNPKGVHEADKLSRTPLHLACWAGKEDFVRMLLEHKASVQVTAIDGVAPLAFASQSGSLGCVRLLLAKGARTDARNSKNQKTALHLAAEKGHLEIVKALLEAGAKPHARTVKQKTAEDLASSEEIKQVLREAAQRKLEALQDKKEGDSKGKGDEEQEETQGDKKEEGGEQEGERSKRGAAEEVAGEQKEAKKPKKAVAATLSFNLDEENEEDLL